jgi:hypothetical protein
MNNIIKQSLKASLLSAILLTTVPSSQAGIHINIAPPAVRIETHEERQGYIWQSGNYRWRNNKHEWYAGHYAREKHGYRWHDGRWDHNEQRGYFWIDGRWER